MPPAQPTPTRRAPASRDHHPTAWDTGPLPMHLLRHVLRSLTAEELARLMLVSKSFRYAAADPSFWWQHSIRLFRSTHRLPRYALKARVNSAARPPFIDSLQTLKAFRLRVLEVQSEDMEKDYVRWMAQRLPTLRELHMRYNRRVGPEAAVFLTHLKYLHTLDLSENKVGDAGAACIGQLTTLTRLDVGFNLLTAQGARHLAALTGLRVLNTFRNPDIGTEGLQYLTVLVNLHTWWHASNGLTDAGAELIGVLTNLMHLDLNVNDLTSQGVRALSRLTKLTKLRLAFNRDLSGDGGMQHLVGLHRLQDLDLDVCSLGDPAVQYIAKLSSLTELDLSSNYGLGPDGLSHLNHLHNLHTLKLNSVTKLRGNHRDAPFCVYALTQLQVLSLHDCDLWDKTVRSLTCLASLTYLNLSNNWHLTYHGVTDLKALTRLRRLDVSKCDVSLRQCRRLHDQLQHVKTLEYDFSESDYDREDEREEEEDEDSWEDWEPGMEEH